MASHYKELPMAIPQLVGIDVTQDIPLKIKCVYQSIHNHHLVLKQLPLHVQ